MIQHSARTGLPARFGVSQWREAHRLASEAERQLFDAAMMHRWGQGPKPPETQRDATAQLRATERALFSRASVEFEAAR